MTFEKSTLQIFANYCTAAAESMAYTLMRTAHSAFIKETQDFSCVMLTPQGLTFASPKTLGATWYPGLDVSAVIESAGPCEPGDICMTNDPYSGYVATHSPDIMMWKPVFYGNEIVCYVGGHVHNTDMGGAVPASLSRTLTEIHQEGIRFPPCKIVRAGRLDESLIRLMELNVRSPEQNRGDLNAQIAMLMIGERRVLEIIARFGIDAFKIGIQALLDYSEEQARTLVTSMPDGQYRFTEYADEDSAGGQPLRIVLTLTIQGSNLEFDFTGSDPQLQSSLNMPTGGQVRHVLALVGLNYVLYTLEPNMLLNAGMLRVARCILPPGSVVNPVAPAAVGMRSLTCRVVQYATLGAFSMALPERMPALPAGGMSIVNVRTSAADGQHVIAAIGPVGGGAGGSAQGDGSDASGAIAAFLSNTPVEINEAEVPIRILRYGLVTGSAGAGKWRGGLGTVLEFKLFAPNSVVTARNRDRARFSSWGVLGGKAGAVSRFSRNPDTPRAEDLGVADLVYCQPGDVIRLAGCGGGGYGPAHERAPDSVLMDVRCGYLSIAQARDDYGVVITGKLNQQIDLAATQQLRQQMAAAQPAPAHFDYGPGRNAFERTWTSARYDALTEILANVPINWRHFLKLKIFAALQEWEQAGNAPPGGAAIHNIFATLTRQYPQLQSASPL